jgi:hypothetical protein
MGAINERFRQRLNEVNHYFELLDAFEREMVAKRLDWKNGRRRLPRIFGDDLSLKLLKAQSLLLLYNLVEATARDTVDSIWEQIHLSGLSVKDVKGPLREIWVGSEFRKLDAFSASASNYRSCATKLLANAMAGTALSVRFRTIGGGGNVDRAVLREICNSHGVPFVAPKGCRDGVDLDDVRGKRNVLAHGEQTFEEVGRQYTVEDLKAAKQRLVLFLRKYVKRVELYVEARAYKAA